jgi:hypothetical protein
MVGAGAGGPRKLARQPLSLVSPRLQRVRPLPLLFYGATPSAVTPHLRCSGPWPTTPSGDLACEDRCAILRLGCGCCQSFFFGTSFVVLCRLIESDPAIAPQPYWLNLYPPPLSDRTADVLDKLMGDSIGTELHIRTHLAACMIACKAGWRRGPRLRRTIKPAKREKTQAKIEIDCCNAKDPVAYGAPGLGGNTRYAASAFASQGSSARKG